MKIIYKGVHFNEDTIADLLSEKETNSDEYFWIIKSEKLYLSKGETFSRVDRFADWVSHNLCIRVKDESYDNKYFYPNFLLIIEIQNGIVKNKFIKVDLDKLHKKQFIDTSLLPYSFYSSSQIRTGLIKILTVPIDKSISNRWIGKISEIVEQMFKKDIYSFDEYGNYYISDTRTEYIAEERIDLKVTDNFIFLYLNEDYLKKYSSKIIEFYIEFLNETFRNNSNLNIKNIINYYPTKIDFDFIKWGIRELKWFVISPSFFERRILEEKNIVLTKLNDVMFDYEIISKEINVKDYLDNEAFDLNLKKINLKFDRINNMFTLFDIKHNSLIGYLKDDNIDYGDLHENSFYWREVSKIIDKINNSREFERDYDSSSDKNWLRDASGTNDPDTMNDVYWNLD